MTTRRRRPAKRPETRTARRAPPGATLALLALPAAALALALALPATADEPAPAGATEAAQDAAKEETRQETKEATKKEASAPRTEVGEPDGAAGARRAGVETEIELVPYVPRERGRARHSAAGGTRTQSRRGGLEVAVLAPADVALTTRAQPVLYWYVSESTDERIDITLTDDASIDPLLEMTVPPPVAAGIHALDLSAHGVSLEAGRTYRWNIAVVRDADRRSTDALAEGMIERTGTSPSLERSLAEASRRFAPYALSGIWYDALAELRSALAANPDDRGLRRQEVALLEQIELPAVARYARTESR